MVLADRLKMGLKEVMEFSVAELELWAGYIQLEADGHKRSMREQKRKKM